MSLEMQVHIEGTGGHQNLKTIRIFKSTLIYLLNLNHISNFIKIMFVKVQET